MDGSQIASLAIAAFSLLVAITAVSVAVWQGRTSKSQLDLAKEQLGLARSSEGETKAALQEIRDISRDSKLTIADLKSSIDERINKILDSKLENEKQSAAMSNEMGQAFMKSIFSGLIPPSGPEGK